MTTSLQQPTTARQLCRRIVMGLLGLVRRLCTGLGLRFCGIYSKPLVSDSGSLPDMADLSFRLFGAADAAALVACTRNAELDLGEAFIHHALGKGDACAAILDRAGNAVSYIWAAFTPTHDCDGVHIGFRQGDVYCYKALTLPPYRGRRLPRAFAVFAHDYCVARGCANAIAYIDLHNVPSAHAMTAQGGRRIGFAGYLKRGPLFFSFRSKAVRERGIHFFLPPDGTSTRCTGLSRRTG